MNIYQLIAQHVENTPNKTAVIYQKQILTYAELIDKVDCLAINLSHQGYSQQSKVALFCSNNIEFVLILLALAKLGAAVAPLPLTLKGQALKTAINTTCCDRVIAWSNVSKQLLSQQLIKDSQLITLGSAVANEVMFADLLLVAPNVSLPVVSRDNDYILTLTSGSTGNPKPIVFTQGTKIERAFHSTINYYQLDATDTVLVATPLYHSLAQRSLLMPLMLGATVVILPKFSVQGWISAVTTHRVSFLFAVASQLIALLSELNKPHDFSALRCIVSSSATLAKDDKDKLLAMLSCRFHECYGASEVGVVTDFDITLANQPIDSVGKPLPGITVKICDHQRQELPIGEIGEIACLTPTRFKGYFNLPDKTLESFDSDGFFYTGDLGYVDSNAYLYFVGRSKDVIKSGGINVYPNDIEQVMMYLDEIKECAAIGVQDEHFGEVIWLAYVLDDSQGEVAHVNDMVLMKHAMSELTDYQLPRKYVQFQQFPKSSLGKILKPEIRQQLQAMSK